MSSTPWSVLTVTLAKPIPFWASMEASDSRECRNCHSYDAMHFEMQSRRAAEKMQKAVKKGETCIECHKGVAHKLPEDLDDD